MANSAVRFRFNNHELVVNAQRAISADKAILISYLNECELEHSWHSRYKLLGKNYFFKCDFMKYGKQIYDPDVTSEEITSNELVDDE